MAGVVFMPLHITALTHCKELWVTHVYNSRKFQLIAEFICAIDDFAYLVHVEVVYSKAALKAIERSNKRSLIRDKIAELAADPTTLGANVIRLEGRPEYRLRVQDWRIIFSIEGNVLRIIEVAPRGSVY